MNRRRFLQTAGAIALGVGRATVARAQTFPGRTVTIVVPFSGGSLTDILARAIAQKLGAKWGQTVIVENRPGIAGAAAVAKTPPDGYTLMLTSNGHTVIKAVNPTVGFDPVTDFVAVTKVATTPSIMIVPTSTPAKTLREFLDVAKASANGLNFASAGRGSATGIAAELLRSLIGAKMNMVAFRGLPESNTAVLRGDAAFAFTFFNVGGDLIQNGDLRALAVTGEVRMPMLPNVPTFREAGLPQFDYDAWFGVLAPAGTPKPIVEQVNMDIADVLADDELRRRFVAQGVNLTPSGAGAFDQQLQSDAKRYGELIAANPG